MERQPNSNIQLPPGFRFHPSDEELIIYYLRNKAASLPVPASIIAEVDLYKYNPWELPKKALFGEEEWYFFSPRDRKYPNGARPNRAAASGYWKATGTDKPILTSCGLQSIGVKKALVFYEGRPPKGIKTDWIMHEYRLLNTMIKPSRLRGSMRLDDWVLCRVRQKGNMPKNLWDDRDGSHSEPRSFFPNVEKQYPTSTELTLEEVANYLQNDFPESPSILPSQGFPCKETVSIVSFQSGNNGNSSSSIYEDGSEKGNSPIAVSSFDRLFNPLKRIAIEGNQEYEPLPCKMLINNEDHYMNHVSSSSKPNNNNNNSYNNTGLNFCRQFQAQDNVFSSNPLNPILDIQELSQLAFTERDLH